MKHLSDYLVHTKKADGYIWTFADHHTDEDKGNYNTSFVHFVREVAHGGALPQDEVFEIVADCIASILECNDADTARDNEPPYPVYTSEINALYSSLTVVLESTYDDYKDYMFSESQAPSEMNQAHVYAYYNMVYSGLVSFLEEDGVWSEEEQASI